MLARTQVCMLCFTRHHKERFQERLMILVSFCSKFVFQYMCSNNYLNTRQFDKVIATIEWCSFWHTVYSNKICLKREECSHHIQLYFMKNHYPITRITKWVRRMEGQSGMLKAPWWQRHNNIYKYLFLFQVPTQNRTFKFRAIFAQRIRTI